MLPQATWQGIVDKISALSYHTDVVSIDQVLSDLSNTDVAWLLRKAFENKGNLSWQLVAAILVTTDVFCRSTPPDLEILWSGPINGLFPVRRFDQVLYDLIQASTKRILLVTFAATKIERLCDHLSIALLNGITISLILEAETESEGQLTHDAIAAFKPIISQGCNVYYWPLERRERNPAGRPGKLHAKCAVVDSKAIIGSANLTDDAFKRNLELGLLLNDPSMAEQIFNHFMTLIQNQVLKRVKT